MSPRTRLGSEQFLELVELAYAAATEPRLWDDVLSRLASVLQTVAASVTLTDLRTIHSSVAWSVGIDPILESEYVRYYSTKNLYLAAGARLMTTGAVISGEDIVPDRIALRSEFVNDFLKPMRVLHHTVGCIHRDGPVTAVLNLPRALGKPSFSVSETAFCRRLLPHFQRALAVHRRLEGVQIERAAVEAALDRLSVGTMIANDRGHAVYLNASASETLAAGDGLSLGPQGLSAARSGDSAMLRRQIRSACAVTALSESTDVVLRIGRPSLRPSYIVMIAPLRLHSFALSTALPRAIVFIYDPDRTRTTEAPLRELYDLTGAEIRVVSMLLQGLRVEEIAQQSGVSVHTVRVHLKRIFSKTETRSQGDLIRVLLTGPSVLRRAPGAQ